MHRAAAVEAEPSPGKRGKCAHEASRQYTPCCCKGAGILKREICAMDKVRVLFKQQILLPAKRDDF